MAAATAEAGTSWPRSASLSAHRARRLASDAPVWWVFTFLAGIYAINKRHGRGAKAAEIRHFAMKAGHQEDGLTPGFFRTASE